MHVDVGVGVAVDEQVILVAQKNAAKGLRFGIDKYSVSLDIDLVSLDPTHPRPLSPAHAHTLNHLHTPVVQLHAFHFVDSPHFVRKVHHDHSFFRRVVGFTWYTQSVHLSDMIIHVPAYLRVADQVTLPDGSDMGTVESLRVVKDKIYTDFFVVSADLITDFELHHLADLHRLHDSSVSCLLKATPEKSEVRILPRVSTPSIARESLNFARIACTIADPVGALRVGPCLSRVTSGSIHTLRRTPSHSGTCAEMGL
jgi:hypothetical protein